MDRVELATFFAPVAYVDHMTSPIAWIAPFSGFVDVSIKKEGFQGAKLCMNIHIIYLNYLYCKYNMLAIFLYDKI